MADLNIAPRTVVDWVEALRPLHAFQAAELILSDLAKNESRLNGAQPLYALLPTESEVQALGRALHAWAALTKAELEEDA